MSDSRTLAHTLIQLSLQENADAHVAEFFTYLQKNNFLGMLPQIMQHVQRITAQEDEYNTLIITSRHQLSPSDIDEIKKITDADDTAKVQTLLSEEVLGSFSAQYRGKMYDGSLQSAVDQMNNTLTATL